ncbi:acyltransferase [Enterobacter cloacae]|uniref:acyltransferase family protein n=1 Tax=Enterobacter cloacae TaxID=550 RepID=UPI002FFD0E02
MLYSIQFLRGIAALLVVFHHTAYKGQVYNTGTFGWLTIGSSGVDLFFVISGFIMCYTTHDKDITFTKFIMHRIKRIIPLYWFFSFAALFVYIFAPSLVNSSGGNTSVVDSFFLLPTESKYLVQNGWTLTYEFYYYIIFSLIILFLPVEKGKYIILTVVLFAFPCIGAFFKTDNLYINFLLSNWLVEFGFGVLLFLIYQKGLVNFKFGLVMLIAAFLMLIFVNQYPSLTIKIDRAFLIGIPMAMLFYSLLSFEFILKNRKNVISNVFEKIGDSSYSLYLSHPFVLSPVAIISNKIGIKNSSLFGLLLVGTALIVGFLVYSGIEKRMIYFTRSKKIKAQLYN